ncbi:hypothetical protein ABZY58_11535 [Micromonospora tulbaghiae]|uniref:hypothetical protein n=1 Tax=Micromonospora tulbaghiae TaxID=479978 RepID=UPI0033B2A7CC
MTEPTGTPTDTYRCAVCGTKEIDRVHWNTPTGAVNVADTCGDECAAVVESARSAATRRLTRAGVRRAAARHLAARPAGSPVPTFRQRLDIGQRPVFLDRYGAPYSIDTVHLPGNTCGKCPHPNSDRASYVSPCCFAAVTISQDDGAMCCKACWHEVPKMLGALPEVTAHPQPLCVCGWARVEHVGKGGACPRKGWPEGTHEAKCGKCGETFNPHGPGDLEHGGDSYGNECGGLGAYRGTWNPPPRSR